MGIQTVSQTICGKDLGKTYMHEHVRIDLSAQKKDADANLDDIKAVIQELKELRSKGISSLVDVTNRGMGRDASVMKCISEASGIQIIASTGFYKEPFLPLYVYDMEEEEISRLMMDDLCKGMDGTEVKAHIIGEIATGEIITPVEEKIFRAAARVHLETGKPIFTHTTLGVLAIEQLSILKEQRVDFSRVVIGHVDLRIDMDYHLRIADTGCFMGFDTIGKIKYQPDEKRIEHLCELIRRGYIDQLLISQDITRKSHLKSYGGIGYSYLLDIFIPMLKVAGIKDDQIDRMMVDNSRRALEV